MTAATCAGLHPVLPVNGSIAALQLMPCQWLVNAWPNQSPQVGCVEAWGIPRATCQQDRSCSNRDQAYLSAPAGTVCMLTRHGQAHKDDVGLAPPKHLLGSSHGLAQRVLNGVLPLVEDEGDAQAGPWDVADATIEALPQKQAHEGLQRNSRQRLGQGAPFSSLQSQASSGAPLLQCGGGTHSSPELPRICQAAQKQAGTRVLLLQQLDAAARRCSAARGAQGTWRRQRHAAGATLAVRQPAHVKTAGPQAAPCSRGAPHSDLTCRFWAVTGCVKEAKA